MTLLAFVMMLFAAQLHGAEMAIVAPDHIPAQMQTHDGHDGHGSHSDHDGRTRSGQAQSAATQAIHAPAAPTKSAQSQPAQTCAGQGGCHGGEDLCDVVCAGLTHTILSDAGGFVLFAPVSTLAERSGDEALDGISPALDQRPPIPLFA